MDLLTNISGESEFESVLSHGNKAIKFSYFSTSLLSYN